MRMQFFVIDSPEPVRSAAFYAELLGAEIDEPESDEEWVQLEGEAEGVPALAFQLSPGLTPPDWPQGRQPQRAHLDLEVTDLDDGERRALAAGAHRHPTQPGARFRVFLDPTGHPFCLVLAAGART